MNILYLYLYLNTRVYNRKYVREELSSYRLFNFFGVCLLIKSILYDGYEFLRKKKFKNTPKKIQCNRIYIDVY